MTTVHATTIGPLTLSAIADDRADYELYQVGLHAHLALRPDDRMSFAEIKLVLRKRTWELGAVWDGRTHDHNRGPTFPNARCRICGCTEDRACPGGCYWTDVDACSRCVPVAEQLDCPHPRQARPRPAMHPHHRPPRPAHGRRPPRWPGRWRHRAPVDRMIRPELGELVPLTALAYRGESCLAFAPGTNLACCLAEGHDEFHVAYQVDHGRLVIEAVWDPPAGVCGRGMPLADAACMRPAGHDGSHASLSLEEPDDGLGGVIRWSA